LESSDHRNVKHDEEEEDELAIFSLPRRRVILTSLLLSSSLILSKPKVVTAADETTTTAVPAEDVVVEDAVVLNRSPTTISRTSNSLLCEDPEARRIEIFDKTSPSVVFIDTFTEQRDIFSTNVYVYKNETQR
jgi:hypothetical protein